MTTKQRGDAVEAHAMKLLSRMGYLAEKARPLRRRYGGRTFTEAHDFFGAFDIIAVIPDARTLFLQVTTDKVAVATKRAQIAPALSHMDRTWHDVQIWRWRGSEKPGEPGSFSIHRWDDDLPTKTSFYISTGAHRWPWQPGAQQSLPLEG